MCVGTRSIHAGLPEGGEDGQDVADPDEVVAVDVRAVVVVQDEAVQGGDDVGEELLHVCPPA